jgi:hypothetical protein
MKNIAIIFIGTGKYADFFPKYYENCEKYFLTNSEKTYFCFTDADFGGEIPNNIKIIETQLEKWPLPTLHRFKTILKEKNNLLNYDYLIYLDADMLVNQKILEEEILTEKDFIGVYHPGFYKKSQGIPYEKRRISQAYVEEDTGRYWQGSLWGGRVPYVFEMIQKLHQQIQIDLEKNIIAEWHDESHINKFFLENSERVYTLGPEYSFPEVYDIDPNKDLNYPNIDPTQRKIIHLLKNHSEIRK